MSDHVAATITRTTTKETAACAIRDLYPGGARLVGELDVFEGERIELAIALDEQVRVAAEVMKVDRQRKVIEVQFRDLADDAAAQIERSIAEMLARVNAQTPSTVLIVHPVLDVSSALERDLARVGVSSHTVTTTAAAIAKLADPSVRFLGVVVAGTLPETGAFLGQLEESYPDLKRVLLWADKIARIDHPASGRVHAVLRTPWRFKGLARGLELPLDDVVTTYDQLVALQVPKK